MSGSHGTTMVFSLPSWLISPKSLNVSFWLITINIKIEGKMNGERGKERKTVKVSQFMKKKKWDPYLTGNLGQFSSKCP